MYARGGVSVGGINPANWESCEGVATPGTGAGCGSVETEPRAGRLVTSFLGGRGHSLCQWPNSPQFPHAKSAYEQQFLGHADCVDHIALVAEKNGRFYVHLIQFHRDFLWWKIWARAPRVSVRLRAPRVKCWSLMCGVLKLSLPDRALLIKKPCLQMSKSLLLRRHRLPHSLEGVISCR